MLCTGWSLALMITSPSVLELGSTPRSPARSAGESGTVRNMTTPSTCNRVATASSVPYLVSVGSVVPDQVKTISDFFAWCRANPHLATYGTGGVGTPMHFTGFMLARFARFEFTHVPYQSSASTIPDLLGGRIAAAIAPIDTTLPHIQSGKVRALATTGPQRGPFLPDVQTIKEVGYPSLEFNFRDAGATLIPAPECPQAMPCEPPSVLPKRAD
jgi:tripartite-type tricarboxylate transporter receptor subunit TctC